MLMHKRLCLLCQDFETASCPAQAKLRKLTLYRQLAQYVIGHFVEVVTVSSFCNSPTSPLILFLLFYLVVQMNLMLSGSSSLLSCNCWCCAMLVRSFTNNPILHCKVYPS